MLLAHPVTLGRPHMKVLEELWRTIQDEYLEMFGLSEHFRAVMDKRRYIAKLKIEKCLSGNMAIQTIIEVEQIELDKLLQQMPSQKEDYYETAALVSQRLQFAIDIRRMSVAEFYSHIKVLSKSKK